MSDEEHIIVRVEPQSVNGLIVAIIGVVGVVVIFLSAIWVRLDLPPRHVLDTGVEGRVPDQMHGVLLTLINADRSSERLNDAQRQEMHSYRWVDRKNSIIRVPIDEAMRLVREGK